MITLMEMHKHKAAYLTFYKSGVENWTLQNADWNVDYFFDFAQREYIDFITLDAVARWISSMVEKGNSSGTILRYVRRLKAFLDWLAKREIIPPHPVQWADLPRWRETPVREKRVFTDEEYKALTSACLKKACINWLHAIVVGRMTGLRISDVCFLKKSAANWKTETIKVTPIKTKKYGKTVTIPMRAELYEVLKARIDDPVFTFPGHEDYFFGEFHLSYMCDRGACLRTMFKTRCNWAGVEGLSFHCLRHTFVSRLANADVSYKVIKSMTGQSITQIAEYHHVDLETQRAAIMKA